MRASQQEFRKQQERFATYLDQVTQVAGHADRVVPMQNYTKGVLLPIERKSVEPMAARLAPTDEVYSMNLAAVYFAQDKYQQAKPLLMELQNSRDHRFADAARSYMKSIARFEQGPVPR